MFVVLQGLRVWVLATLGPYWTTRIITKPGAPLVRRGPYRYVRHPNYLIVAGEIAVLPLVFGEIAVAVVFTVLNATRARSAHPPGGHSTRVAKGPFVQYRGWRTRGKGLGCATTGRW